MDISGHILRRGVSAYLGQPNDDNPGKIVYQLPTWVILMISTTVIGFLFVMFMINYTFGQIIPTLLMIESPDALFEPLPTIDPDSDAPLDPNAAISSEPISLKLETITSSFRRTLRHLQAKGGRTARFRGFSIYIVKSTLIVLAARLFSAIPYVPAGVAVALSTVLFANFSMAWTHIVISDPNPKPWFRRLPSMRMYRKIVAPTAVLAVAEQLSALLPDILAGVYGFKNLHQETPPTMSGGKVAVVVLEVLSIFFLSLTLALIFVIPAKVVLTRVQASLLDDAEETIVPFDRSFGGKVVPELVGGTGCVSMLDAWKTFDWTARFRLLKAYIKVIAMQLVVMILFAITMAIEVFAIAQIDLKKLMPGGGHQGGDGEI